MMMMLGSQREKEGETVAPITGELRESAWI